MFNNSKCSVDDRICRTEGSDMLDSTMDKCLPSNNDLEKRNEMEKKKDDNTDGFADKSSVSKHDPEEEKGTKKEQKFVECRTVAETSSFNCDLKKENYSKKENKVDVDSTVDKNTHSSYVFEMEKEMQKKKDDYKEDMGFFYARWDSKLPEDEKTKYKFISLARSDSENIRQGIVQYETFYKEAKDLLNEISPSDPSNVRKKLMELKQRMSTQLQSAKTDIKTTSSSAIYHLHESFIQNYHKLEFIVVDFENEALHKSLIEMETRWKNAVTTIEELQKNFKDVNKKYDEVCEKYDDICEKYDQVCKTLKENQETSLEYQRKLKDDNENMKLQLQEILKRLGKSSYPRKRHGHD